VALNYLNVQKKISLFSHYFEALKEILSSVSQFPRQVIIMTDGEVSDSQQVIHHVRSHCNTTRVWTFGIGSAFFNNSQNKVKILPVNS
jgi:hypothetical protein